MAQRPEEGSNNVGATTAAIPEEIRPIGRSRVYELFPPPFDPKRNGFDFHVYYMPSNDSEVKFARQLYENIKKEFPELQVGRFWDKPIGPHPTAMFEVDTVNPHQTGAVFGWLAVNRGPCSVMVHPNTDDVYRDHSELVSWMGKSWPLNTDMLKKFRR